MIVRLLRRALLVSAIALAPLPALAASGEICAIFNSDPSEERVVLVLIDRTSPLRADAQKAVRNAVAAAKAAAQQGDRLQIAAISDSMVNRRTLYDDCKPGQAPSIWKRPLEPEQLKHYTTRFEAEIAAVVESELKRKTVTKTSALVESIAEYSKLFRPGTLRQVFLASDLLDNTQFGLPKAALAPYDRQQLLAGADSIGRIAKLRSVSVTVYGFGVNDEDGTRLPDDRRRDIEALWAEYFRRSGASFQAIVGN